MSRRWRAGFFALVGLAATPAAAHARFVFVNLDDPGVGLNETTAAQPVGGNPGVTLGEQRLNVFNEAGRIWGEAIDSDADIRVEVSFAPLQCTPTEGILGGAQPSGFALLDRAPRRSTWYTLAEAARFVGQAPTGPSINVQFSASLDEPGCLDGAGWYYGFDHQHGTKRDLLAVTLHELAHGLGFLSATTSTFTYEQSKYDVWASALFDAASQKHWDELSTAGRAASATSGALVWDGPAVKAAAATTMGARAVLRLVAAPLAPGLVDRDLEVGEATFGGSIDEAGLTAPLALFHGPDAGCGPSPEPIDGRLAVIDRGGCFFVDKAAFAQDAGALGVVIVNNVGGIIVPAGTRDDITIPVVAVSLADGLAMKAALDGGTVTAKLYRNPALLAGVRDGRLSMYAPATFETGSSVSHWDTSANPNLLMEPYLSGDLDGGLDLTVALLEDIDWFKTDLSLTSSGATSLTRGKAATVTLEVVNPGPSPSAPVTVAMEGVNVALQTVTGDCAGFPCSLGALPAQAHRSTIVALLPGQSGETPTVTFSVDASSNYDPDNDHVTLSAPAGKACGCGAAEAGPLGVLGLLLMVRGRWRRTPARGASGRGRPPSG